MRLDLTGISRKGNFRGPFLWFRQTICPGLIRTASLMSLIGLLSLVVQVLHLNRATAAASGEMLQDVLLRMKPEGKKVYFQVTGQLIKAGNFHFFRIDGYQALILRTTCSEIYGKTFTGEIPPLLQSGWKIDQSRARSRLESFYEQIDATVKRCENAELAGDLLKTYWEITALPIENFLFRLSKLINVQSQHYEALIWGRPVTAHIEEAIRMRPGNLPAFAEAILIDTDAFEANLFQDLDQILKSAYESIQNKKRFQEIFQNS